MWCLLSIIKQCDWWSVAGAVPETRDWVIALIIVRFNFLEANNNGGCSWVSEPTTACYFADEPTGNLDEKMKRLNDLLQELIKVELSKQVTWLSRIGSEPDRVIISTMENLKETLMKMNVNYHSKCGHFSAVFLKMRVVLRLVKSSDIAAYDLWVKKKLDDWNTVSLTFWSETCIDASRVKRIWKDS